MPLPQDIRPAFQNIQDTLIRADQPWIEQSRTSSMKVEGCQKIGRDQWAAVPKPANRARLIIRCRMASISPSQTANTSDFSTKLYVTGNEFSSRHDNRPDSNETVGDDHRTLHGSSSPTVSQRFAKGAGRTVGLTIGVTVDRTVKRPPRIGSSSFLHGRSEDSGGRTVS